MQPLGIALIGYGGIGRVHAMAYRDLPFHYGLPADTIRLVGVATTRRETAERAAREIGCSVWTDDYRTLLGRDDVQAVDICVPNFWHEEIVSAAAQAGKHIYCEKPLAMDAAQAWRMVQAVEEAASIFASPRLCCGPGSWSTKASRASSSPSAVGITGRAISRPRSPSPGA